MRELSLIVLEMERQGKRLNRLLRVAHLNTLTLPEFQELVAVIERLQINLTDFNVRHFGPEIPLRETKEKAPPRLRQFAWTFIGEHIRNAIAKGF